MTDTFYSKLAKVRHYIHEHPEISEQEYETTKYIKNYLSELEIKPLDYPLETGVIAEIGSGLPIIALRADIDALPIVERTNLDYASSNGAMHACGHDFHQTSLLGAAELLKEREAELNGTVRLIFQPAEENFQGGYKVIEAGGLENVSAIIGYHNNPHLKPGQIGLRSGAIMAGVEQFKVIVNGVSAHAARPDLGVDTVLVITTIINNLQNIVSRTVSPFESAVLSVTHIDVGTTWNVLPANGYFEGTIRSFDPEVRLSVIERFEKVVKAVSQQFDARVEINWGNAPNVTFNDRDLTPIIFENSKKFAEVIETLPSTGGEDFAAYQEKIPGVFAFVGSNGEENAPDWHHDDFIVRDEALPVAVNYFVESAFALLNHFKKE
ncbi:M20 peptidase aminoacylase family protein [Streptococcus thermophilus]|uniref:Aminoacylase/N-acyl-L-amino acid amidohydrolase/hippurate hydrolase n=2 Tax=Streptococcus thermophilus TaxID=1308 RepID=A0A2X3UV36_STRTR|nr:M20 peptidase aminoacylase family protein [Streptococcus thermophilus]ETW88855.1 peptidase M20 [Streptococcus thermophilus M17PTZA496]MBW7822742.1 M20 peptidase aminoacylase family protein [Streptococcus thermophilus]MCE2078371.1 amidohydrolase [Streptococcus thermophilus]MCE2226870.1 amidohydrolase [Streptococcus thermophilus]MCE2229232.1 amidohydrolase [Streptococcus thermophilus]